MKPTKYTVKLRITHGGWCSLVDLSNGRGKALEGREKEVYLASEVDTLLAHRWVPIAECGELKPGVYWTLRNCEPVEGILRDDGRWRMATMCVVGRNIFTHILSPWMGPLPEAREL